MIPSFLSVPEAPLFKFIAFALIASGCYFLLGPGRKERGLQRWARKLLGGGVIVLGLLLPGLMPREGMIWNEYDPEILRQARSEDKPAALYFYADWCAPCLKMDRLTFSEPRVLKAMEHFVRIKADVTDMKSSRAEALLSQYNVRSVPVLIFIDESGMEIPRGRLEGFIGAEKFLSILQSLRSKTSN